MYVSGIRVSSFLTIMYLWNGKQKTNTHVLLKKKKQYNNVVVLNVQSLFAKEETNKNIVYNCSWTVPISQQKGCAEIEHTLTQRKQTTHTETLVENQFLDPTGSVGAGLVAASRKKKQKCQWTTQKKATIHMQVKLTYNCLFV